MDPFESLALPVELEALSLQYNCGALTIVPVVNLGVEHDEGVVMKRLAEFWLFGFCCGICVCLFIQYLNR